jgi:oligopeptide/dipeptide ABC transporter ATP-binding protein
MSPLLQVDELSLSLPVGRERREILRGVSLSVAAGEAVGLVGESGSGKSMTARAIARMLPRGAEVGGRVQFDGASVHAMGRKELNTYRRQGISFVSQDPRSAINPVHSVGDFLTESLRVNDHLSASEAHVRAVTSLADVGIADGARRMAQYPHQLSGGLLQRVMICSALLAGSRLIVADEPTTALDVTTQSGVISLLDTLRRERGVALLFITHDLELAAAMCDRICVMYAGEIVEMQAAVELEQEPRHPYTRALFAARPSIDTTAGRLPSIPGRPVAAYEVEPGCAFLPRCSFAVADCALTRPSLELVGDAFVRCIRAREFPALTSVTRDG